MNDHRSSCLFCDIVFLTLSRYYQRVKNKNFTELFKCFFPLDFLKNHTHEGGAPQNFFLAFIDELEKQLFIKKTVEVSQ